MAADDPKLRLTLVDVNGKPLGELVDIDLRHQVLSDDAAADEGHGCTTCGAGMAATVRTS